MTLKGAEIFCSSSLLLESCDHLPGNKSIVLTSKEMFIEPSLLFVDITSYFIGFLFNFTWVRHKHFLYKPSSH